MTPTVTQQLQSISNMMTKAILPASGDEHAAVQGLLAAPTPAGVDVPGTRLRTAKLKRCAEQVYASVTAGDDAGARTRARELMTAAAQRQCTREQSWARMTGFPKRVEGAIDAVLDAQEAGRQ